MPFIHLLRPDQRAALRRLKRLANAGAPEDRAVPLLDDLTALGQSCLRWQRQPRRTGAMYSRGQHLQPHATARPRRESARTGARNPASLPPATGSLS